MLWKSILKQWSAAQNQGNGIGNCLRVTDGLFRHIVQNKALTGGKWVKSLLALVQDRIRKQWNKDHLQIEGIEESS